MNLVKKKQLRKETERKKFQSQAFQAKMFGKSNTEIIQQLNKDEQERVFTNAIQVGEFFNISGVYYLFKNKTVVYVGESSCIFTRLSQHIGVKDFDHFKYIVLETEKERKHVERLLIKKHRPIYNLAHNTSITL